MYGCIDQFAVIQTDLCMFVEIVFLVIQRFVNIQTDLCMVV